MGKFSIESGEGWTGERKLYLFTGDNDSVPQFLSSSVLF